MTSHLFFLGDLNFRLDIPSSHVLSSLRKSHQFGDFLSSEEKREEIRHFDQLTIEKKKGTIFTGFHEGEFWKFKCSYKYKLGEVDRFEYVYVTTLELHLTAILVISATPHGRIVFCLLVMLIYQRSRRRHVLMFCYTRPYHLIPHRTT